jgi:hypothetical protein
MAAGVRNSKERRVTAVDESRAAGVVALALRDPSGAAQLPATLDGAALVAAASEHRVLVLLGWTLRAAGALDAWPAEFRDRFRAAERSAAALDCARQVELRRVLSALDAAGTRTLLLKGAALAYTDYPAPHLRTRTDTDLLIRAADVTAADETLAALGYVRQQETSGKLVTYQSHYVWRDQYGILHPLDVHWKISDRQALANTLSFDELWDTRIEIPALGQLAATASAEHALVIALVHRAGHHPGSRDLLWIYDIHLLAGRLDEGTLQRIQAVAIDRGLGRIACEGLMHAHEWFHTTNAKALADAVIAAAMHAPAAPWWHPTCQADVLNLDLQALPTWRARASLLREHLFPSSSYMRSKYGIRSSVLLPPLYVWRIIAGAPGWLHRGEPR